MSLRRKPNPNRNHPLYCPYCAGETLFPNEETEFAWFCTDCTRIFEVKYYGQDDPEQRPAPAKSTSEALKESLAKHGHLINEGGDTPQ
ncbi:hypothetical protein [Corynebacterium callunae]|uniref:Ferredoxin-like protein n=1 Tax=Corynebacterium callunae DSM 20147 TaxID=1121353 RepID=M1UW12_9CORY|nr:hypothetical protein [Corynebacterium callunae]AGG67792.1 hypothetical protein H924_11830 [Corynebacterium callunae DSM 20147]